jgi:hypothetical protein
MNMQTARRSTESNSSVSPLKSPKALAPTRASPETRRCFTPTTAGTIAILRPLRFARWGMYFTFRDIVAHADRLVEIVLKAKSK